MKHDVSRSFIDKKFMEAMWLMQACGNLEIQVIEAARRSRARAVAEFVLELEENLADLEVVLKSIELSEFFDRLAGVTRGYIESARASLSGDERAKNLSSLRIRGK